MDILANVVWIRLDWTQKANYSFMAQFMIFFFHFLLMNWQCQYVISINHMKYLCKHIMSWLYEMFKAWELVAKLLGGLFMQYGFIMSFWDSTPLWSFFVKYYFCFWCIVTITFVKYDFWKGCRKWEGTHPIAVYAQVDLALVHSFKKEKKNLLFNVRNNNWLTFICNHVSALFLV